MKQIKLKFNPKTGEARIEANGFTGSSCKLATQFLADTLGQMTDFREKSEYFELSLGVDGKLDSNLCG